MQPDCLFPDPAPPIPIAPTDPALPAMWFAVAMFVAFAIFELWALHTGHNTLSHWLQHLAKRHHWLRIVGVLGGGWLLYHLFW